MPTPSLVIDNVAKQYPRKVWGLRDVSLTLGTGIVGLLGPNGAGKSTLMRILATISQPTQGRITWNGNDITRAPEALRSTLGYLPQDFGVYPNLSAREFLEYLAAVKGLHVRAARARIDDLLALVNLHDAAHRRLGGFSGGMRQRIGIAQALLNDPDLLIVDEPTVGLDPEERVRFRNLLTDLAGERIVILSTHIVSDVEATASQIALIDRGRLLVFATPEVLLAGVRGSVWEWTIPAAELPAARERYRVSSTIRTTDGVKIRVIDPEPPTPAAVLTTPTLEDAYLHALAVHRQGVAV
jgi:ABC-type multidrug transport system ATPase subunit